MGNPVHIAGHIEGIILLQSFGIRRHIFPCVKDAHTPAVVLKIAEPGPLPMIRHIRISAGQVIGLAQLLFLPEDRMGRPEGDELLYVFRQKLPGLSRLPVDPGQLIVLTVYVIIA